MNGAEHLGLKHSGDAKALVSVVVIGYNQQDFAPLAVNSILAQSHKRLECIFVDDGSQDATFERIQVIARTDPRLRTYRKANGGPASARNFGATHVSMEAEFIAFLDGDDLFHADFVEVCYHYLSDKPNVGIVIPMQGFIDTTGRPLKGQRRGYRWVPSALGLFPRRLSASEPATPFVTFYCGTGMVPFWLARTAAYRQCEGWDESLWMFEDADMLCQLAMVTEVHAIDRELVSYRIHAQQATNEDSRGRRRTRHGLGSVQEKWNRRVYPDRQKNRILDRACIYYRQVHLPFRALWVAQRAFTEFVHTPSRARLTWLARLGYFFLRNFFYFKVLFWRSTRRYIATRFEEVARPRLND